PTSPPAAVAAAVAAAQDYHHTTATHQHLAQVARTAHTDRAYRDTARIGYTELVIDYGNDGPRDSDRALPAADHGRRATLIDFIEHHTGVPSPHIRHQIGEAVYAYSRAPGTDDDPDYFAPPAWDSFFTQWQAEQAERQEILDDAKGAARWDPGPAEHDPHFLTWTTLAEAAEAAAQAQHAADAAAGKSADDVLTEILTGLDTGTDLRDGPLTGQDDDGDDDGGGWGDEPAAGEIRLGGQTSLAGRDYAITDGTTTPTTDPTTATTAHDDPPPREQKQITASPGDTPVTEGATPTPPPGQLRPASQRPPRAAAAVAAAHDAITSLPPREGTGHSGQLTQWPSSGHSPAQHTRDQADDAGPRPLF
ncbi:MAG: hypothetical protein ACRDQ9_05930, partial [Pseudonocardiaceae bacterium]